MNGIKIYTEIGVGNESFVSTEIEEGEAETRRPGFIRMRLKGVYVRVWLGYAVWILSTRNGFTRMKKPRKTFKLLLGFEGVPR